VVPLRSETVGPHTSHLLTILNPDDTYSCILLTTQHSTARGLGDT
jgi:hypothetical protein